MQNLKDRLFDAMTRIGNAMRGTNMAFTQAVAQGQLEQYATDVAGMRTKYSDLNVKSTVFDFCLNKADAGFSSANQNFTESNWRGTVDALSSGRFYLELAQELMEEFQSQLSFASGTVPTKELLPQSPKTEYCDGDDDNLEYRALALLITKAEASKWVLAPEEEHVAWAIDAACGYLNVVDDGWDEAAQWCRDGRFFADIALKLIEQSLENRGQKEKAAPMMGSEEWLDGLSDEDDDDVVAAREFIESSILKAHQAALAVGKMQFDFTLARMHLHEAIAFRDAAQNKFWNEKWDGVCLSANEATTFAEMVLEMVSTYHSEVAALEVGVSTYEEAPPPVDYTEDIDVSDDGEDDDDSEDDHEEEAGERQDVVEEWRVVALRGAKAQAYLDARATAFVTGKGFMSTAQGYMEAAIDADTWGAASAPLRDARLYFNLMMSRAREFVKTQ